MLADHPLQLRLPITMSVADARAALRQAGEGIAIVTSRAADVGVVTADDLDAEGLAPAASIADVMGREVVRIDPHADLHGTLRAYREAAWSSAIRRRPGAPPCEAVR
jgi:hypothetical protein